MSHQAATLPTLGSIFAGSLRKDAPQPAPHPPARIVLVQAPRGTRPPIAPAPTAPAAPPRSLESVMLEILEAPLPATHTAAVGYRFKEEALGAIFARLSPAECRTLYKRLATPIDGDVLAAQFAARLTGERRNRLLVFLADARRREAIAVARR